MFILPGCGQLWHFWRNRGALSDVSFAQEDNQVWSLLKFFALTYAVTWACFLAAVAISHGSASAVPALTAGRWLMLLLGTFAPSLVALGVTARENGTLATRALLRRVFEWRVEARWYFFAVGLIGVIKLTCALPPASFSCSMARFSKQ